MTPSRNQSFNYFKRILNEIELDKFKISFQSEKSFFERLKVIFKEKNLESGSSFIHLTGTDIPDFPFHFIQEEIFSNLKLDDIVIGPDEDGGFYYLGMNAKFYNLFDLLNDHELKNESVLEQLVNHCKKIGLG